MPDAEVEAALLETQKSGYSGGKEPKRFMKSDKWLRTRARELYQEDGRIEVDDNARVSSGDDGNGAYVQAWVWVPSRENESDS